MNRDPAPLNRIVAAINQLQEAFQEANLSPVQIQLTGTDDHQRLLALAERFDMATRPIDLRQKRQGYYEIAGALIYPASRGRIV